MFYIKKCIAICLSIAMVMCSTLPSLASGNDALQETTESKIVEQLKEDLGEENANEILNAYEETRNEDVGDAILSTYDEEPEETETNASTENVGVSTASPEEETDEDVSSEPEETETRTGELYEPEEDETSVSESYDFEENVEESTESLEEDETNIDESDDGNLDKNIATSSELDDECEVIELDVEKENSEDSLLGASETWMWWYLTDNDSTMHLSSTQTISIAIPIDINDGIVYTSLTKGNIVKIILDDVIVADTCKGMFSNFYNLEEIIDLDNLETSEVTNMSGMFQYCKTLKTLNLSNFNTSNVTNMNSMFYGCESLETLNLSNFNTSNVTNMNSMFCDCESLESLNLSNLNTSNVTSMNSMFLGCVSIEILDVSSFNTSNVKDMRLMFAEYDLTRMSSKVSSLTTIIGLNNFNTENVTSMYGMFKDLKKLNSIDLSNFDTSSVTIMSYMFENCQSLENLDLGSFDTSNVKGMRNMFSGCHSLTNLNISNFNTSAVTIMREMFMSCESITNIDVSSFDTTNVYDMGRMFLRCKSLTELDVSSFNTKKVIYMDYMFALGGDARYDLGTGFGTQYRFLYSGSSATKIVGIDNFDTSNVEDFSCMFSGCSSLENLDVSNFNTSKATSLLGMFSYCSSITTLNLSSFNTNKVSEMSFMFNDCSSLETIYVSNSFTISKVNEDSSMFQECTALIGGNGTVYNSKYYTANYARIDSSTRRGYFTFLEPALNSISINTKPYKVKYKIGEIFNPNGLKINLVYSDSTNSTVTYSNSNSSYFQFSNTVFDTAGSTIQVTITYSGKTCTQDVEVIAPQSITVKTAPSKLKYAIGETFNPTALKINLVYSDTTTVEEVAYAGNESDFSFNPSGALNTAGSSIPITITYTKNGSSFNCIQNVEVVELSSISINSVPSKTRYIKGTNFDPTGLKINLNYNDSSTEIVTYNTTTSVNFTFNGGSTLILDTVGNPFEITIGYAGKTCIQNVIVAELSSIAISTHATKLNYNAGETFDPSGLVITLTYSDSVTEPVAYNTTTSSDFEFSPNGPLTRTGNVITVTYAGKTTTETLNVKELTSITIATNPTKLSYATGQSLNPNGLVLTLTFTDSNNVNTTENVTYNSTTQSKFAFNPSGTAITTGNVTVTYDGKTGAGMQPTFAITVRTVASISVINSPSKTSYSSGNKLSPAGLSIKVNYTDGTNETIAYSSSNSGDFSFNPSTSTSLNTGHANVTVTYGGKSTSFAISVTQSSGGYVPSSGGGNNSGGGVGGGGGGGGIPAGTNPQNDSPTTTQTTSNKSISGVADSSTSTWATDPTTGKWKLNITLGNGQVAPATNGFFMLTNTVTQVVNNVPIQTQVNNTYYFDAQGNMVTGWVQTADNKWYFFDNEKTANEGKMSLGWKQVQGSWYYFTPDGYRLENGITPDGFVIGADGKWIG